MNEIRCKHRHTISEHPACFAEGKVLEPLEYKVPWYQTDGYRIGYLDIEADGLTADFSTMLSWCIKEREGKIKSDVITKEELFNGETDKRITESLINELKKYAIIITYYGTNFDMPYIRSKSLYHNIEFIPYGLLYHFDLYYSVKSKLCLSRNSLDNACSYLGIPGKTHLDRNVWRLAKYGDPKALRTVLLHNKYDVIILEKLHSKLEDFSKWTKRSI